MGKLVSVIIPLYNCQQYIERCVNSLINQTYDNIEILIIDDGSTDKSADVVIGLQKRTDRIRYFYQENKGPGAARNHAIRESRGAYLLFVDADDYLSSDYIENMVTVAINNSSDLVIAGYTLVYQDGKKNVEIVPLKYEKNISEEWVYRIASSWGRLYRKDFWINNNLKFHEIKGARAEDVPITLYANAMAKNISIVQNPGYYYYQHPESAMNKLKAGIIFGFPYEAFGEMYHTLENKTLENGRQFYHFGILKFLAQFELVIYRKADKEEKKKFRNYVKELLKEDKGNIVSDWKSMRAKLDIPITYKVAIEIFIRGIG